MMNIGDSNRFVTQKDRSLVHPSRLFKVLCRDYSKILNQMILRIWETVFCKCSNSFRPICK